MSKGKQWKPISGYSWWCIVRRDFDRDWYMPWLMASTRRGAWDAWREHHGEMATRAFRSHYKAVKVIMTEVAQ